MSLLKTLTILCAVYQTFCDKSDIGLNVAQMIANHGYQSETHEVTTDDGYIITLYRVPHGINDNSTARRPPVLLTHGFGFCSAQFVSLGPERSLAYILAEAGYDVWLGNARGTRPSRKHISIDVDTDPGAFFDFTWHEIGYYDVANSIDYILDVNGDDRVHYIGHSQGTTALLALLSTRPEYNSKIKLASLMAPAAIIQHYPSFIFQDLCTKYLDQIWSVLQKLKIYEVPFMETLQAMVTTLCVDYPNGVTNSFCDFAYNWRLQTVNKEDTPVVFSNCPSTAGLKQYIHFGQLVRDGGFRQFDHGKEKNLEIYGSETPPDYDLSKISVPVACYYTKGDGIVTVEDESTTVSMIPNVVINYLVPDASFGHGDFGMDNRAVELVYNELVSVMAEY